MRIPTVGLLTILCLGMLAGCGNSGDLYLPEDTAETFITDPQLRES